MYASLGGTERRKSAFITATALPTVIFAVVFLLNFFLIMAGSSGAVPLGTMLFVVILWFGISAPLSWVGSYFGGKAGVRFFALLGCLLLITCVSCSPSLIRLESTQSPDKYRLVQNTFVLGWVFTTHIFKFNAHKILKWASILSGILPFGTLSSPFAWRLINTNLLAPQARRSLSSTFSFPISSPRVHTMLSGSSHSPQSSFRSQSQLSASFSRISSSARKSTAGTGALFSLGAGARSGCWCTGCIICYRG